MIHGVHRLALLSRRLLHGGRVVGLGLMGGRRRVPLALLTGSWTRSLVESLAQLTGTHDLTGVGAHVGIGALTDSASHGAVLGLVARVLGTGKTSHALLVLVGVGGLPGRGLRVPGRVAHAGVALSLWRGVPHLASAHTDVAQVVRWLLGRGVCHALWRVVLIHARCAGCIPALHPAVVALGHLVAAHLVWSAPCLCWGLLIS